MISSENLFSKNKVKEQFSKDTQMKIVCIAASYVPSNTANSIQVLKATDALASLGNNVTLLVPGDKSADWVDLKAHYGLQQSFEIRWLPEHLSFRRYDFALKAVREAVRMKPDLIYTWMLQSAVLSLWRGLPVILELHDRVTGRLGPWLFEQFWRTDTKKRLLTNTTALKKILVKEYGLKDVAEDIFAAPNGVDLERYSDLLQPEAMRAELGLPQAFTAGYTGHFYAGRGMELMLNLAKTLPEINFLWVGGHPKDIDLWKERLAEAGVNNVTLTGFVDNAILPRYQAAADVLLMPYGASIAGSSGGDSAEVASPMKMFEYLATGRAIISSDLPVIREVLDETNAVFCPPDDLAVWKGVLTALMRDPSHRENLSHAARNTASNYTWRARAENALDGFTLQSAGSAGEAL